MLRIATPFHTSTLCFACLQNGWDVVVARWPMLAMWFPLWGHALASSLIAALGHELQTRGHRPVVFWCFSGAAKVWHGLGCAATAVQGWMCAELTLLSPPPVVATKHTEEQEPRRCVKQS